MSPTSSLSLWLRTKYGTWLCFYWTRLPRCTRIVHTAYGPIINFLEAPTPSHMSEEHISIIKRHSIKKVTRVLGVCDTSMSPGYSNHYSRWSLRHGITRYYWRAPEVGGETTRSKELWRESSGGSGSLQIPIRCPSCRMQEIRSKSPTSTPKDFRERADAILELFPPFDVTWKMSSDKEKLNRITVVRQRDEALRKNQPLHKTIKHKDQALLEKDAYFQRLQESNSKRIQESTTN